MEEEAEAVKIQKEKAKFLSLEDFGLEEADEDGSDSDAKEKKQKVILYYMVLVEIKFHNFSDLNLEFVTNTFHFNIINFFFSVEIIILKL